MNRYLNIRLYQLLFVAVWITARSAFPCDLGTVGQVYPIEESDFLVFIKQHIEEIQKNGEWEKIQTQLKERVSKHADRPTSLLLPRTLEAKTWNINPSITVPYDIKDAEGKVITPAGTTVNPLSIISLTKELIFYDADDKNQVMWVADYHKKLKQAGIKDKLILVGGSVVDQSNLFSCAIYFDQEGKLVKKFGIQHVPAVVKQSGLSLKIMEVLP